MKINNRQQSLAILAALALGFLIADHLIVMPLFHTWRDRSDQVKRLNKSITEGNILTDRERIIRERWNQMRTNTLPTNVSVAENQVLSAFDKWAQDSRIAIGGIKPQWKNGNGFMTLECQVEAFGNIQALTRFIYDIESDPMALKIAAMNIGKQDKSGDQLSLSLHVSGLLLQASSQ